MDFPVAESMRACEPLSRESVMPQKVRPDFDTQREARYPRDRTRRQFLLASGTGAATLLGASRLNAAESLTITPAAFDATSDSVLIWVSGQSGTKVRVDYNTESPTALKPGPVAGLSSGNDFTSHVTLTGLPAAAIVHYRAVDADSGNALSEICSCRTAPARAQLFSFAFSGDMEESYRPFRLFDVIAQAKPAFFLHLGDTIYADHPKREFSPSLAHYRRKHRANRRDTHLRRFLAQHTTYATWDDHEIENDCHAAHPNMGEAQQVFREFWPCRSVTPNALYRAFDWAGVDFIMLDTRSFRSPQNAPDGPGKTMLGSTQKAWLEETLSASKAKFKFIATSVPFHGGGMDTWGPYRSEQQDLVRFIKDQKMGGVVFLCADYHLARDWTNPKTGLREYMAGPIASFTHYSRTPYSRDRYQKAGTFHYGDGYNFGLVTVDPEAGTGFIEWIGLDGKVLGKIEFAA